MLRPGTRLGDRYQVIEQIAAGGMGTLWRAHHVELDVDVALKVVAAATPGSLKRFKREAQAVAKLRSPNIVQVLDYGEFEGHPYLAMELLRGEDLSARIARAGKLPCDTCMKIINGVAKAVQVAHDAGIVHRDLKPANIFLERIGSEEEVVKVLDFGVAKDLAARPEPGSTTGVGVVGSPAYMSPEQVWGQPLGHRVDLWAMGVLIFEMLSGRNPFFDETLARIFERIVRDPLPKIRELEPGLPRALGPFFERALAREPSERFASAKEVAEALRVAIGGSKLPDRASNPPQHPMVARVHTTEAEALPLQEAAHKRQKLRHALVWIGAALTIAAGAGLFAQSRQGNEPEPAPAAGAPASAQPSAAGALPGAANPSATPGAPVPLVAPSASAMAPAASTPGPASSSAARAAPKTHASRQRTGATAPAPPVKPAPEPNTAPASPPARALDPRFGIPLQR